MDWEGMARILQMWKLTRLPFFKDCILNFIENLSNIGTDLLNASDAFTAAQYFAKAIQLANQLHRDGYLNARRDKDKLNHNYFMHAQACILYSDLAFFLPEKSQILDYALHSLRKVSGDLLASKVALRLVANLKKELVDYDIYNSSPKILGEKFRRYNKELQTFDSGKMNFVVSFFGYADTSEFLQWISSIIGPDIEGNGATASGAELEWIPKEHQQIAQRRQTQKQPHSKKKRSRRDGKDRPSEASTSTSQAKAGRDGKKGQSSKVKASGASSTRPSAGRHHSGSVAAHKNKPQGIGGGPCNKTTSTITRTKDWTNPNRHSNQRPAPCSDVSTSNTSRSHGAGPMAHRTGPGLDQTVLGTDQNSTASAETWLSKYKFRLACNKCFTKVPQKHGYDSYKLNPNPTHFPKCARDLLLCQLAVAPKNGHPAAYYGIIRSRPCNAKHLICEDFQHGDPCKDVLCCYSHSREEKDIWKAEEQGRFPREFIMALLKKQGHTDGRKLSSKNKTPVGSQNEHLDSDESGEWKTWTKTKPRRESRVSQGSDGSKNGARSRSGSQYDLGGRGDIPNALNNSDARSRRESLVSHGSDGSKNGARSRSGSQNDLGGRGDIPNALNNSDARSRRESQVSHGSHGSKNGARSRSGSQCNLRGAGDFPNAWNNSNARSRGESEASQGMDGSTTETRIQSGSKFAIGHYLGCQTLSNDGAPPQSENPVSEDNSDFKHGSGSSSGSLSGNEDVDSTSDVAESEESVFPRTSIPGLTSIQHPDVAEEFSQGSESSREMYEAGACPMPVQNPYRGGVVETSVYSQNLNSVSAKGHNPLVSSRLPFWKPGINMVYPGQLSSQNSALQDVQGIPTERPDQEVLDGLKGIFGSFLLVCLHCFERRPQIITPLNPAIPNSCSHLNHTKADTRQRCLVHQIGQGYSKIRERPFRMMRKQISVCWHFSKPYGCERGDSCHFAHSLAESQVWWLEARLRKERKAIHEACIQMNQPTAPLPASLPYLSASTPECHPCGPGTNIASTAGTAISDDRTSTSRSNSSTKINNSERKGDMSVKQSPPSARAIAVQSCIQVPFGHRIKLACGRCLREDPRRAKEQNPNRPSYCSGRRPHSWCHGNTVYVVHSTKEDHWVRVNTRHPRLFPTTKLNLCRKGKNCRQIGVFGTPCMHPHSQEELELWEYQKRHNLPKLEDVVRLQKQASLIATPRSRRDQTAAPQHTCSFCKFSCVSRTDFENHLLTAAHKAKIFSDSDRVWNQRDPPNIVQDGGYELCKENATRQCEHSGKSKSENECIYAHSTDELSEWTQRHHYRFMKLRKAQEEKLYSWLDVLVDKKAGAEDEEDVITEEIFGIEVDCTPEREVIKETPIEGESDVASDAIKWKVTIHCGDEKKLKRVGLLFDEHRSHFHLSEPENEYLPQTCPGSRLRIDDDAQSYTISVIFTPSCPGLFKQWLIFDFGDLPCLVLKLSVTSGSKSEMKEFEFKEQAVNTAELWNKNNSEIIEYEKPGRWIRRMEEQYPTPGSDRGPTLEGDVLSLTKETYRDFMHGMLIHEERACMEMVAKYLTVTTMDISNNIKLEDDSVLFAQGLELFGTIMLDKPLHDDSDASRLFQELVDTIFVKFHEQSDVVYETKKVTSMKNTVMVNLGPNCVEERGLKNGEKVSVTIQCRINRWKFLMMHYSLDQLQCMDTILPKELQPNRFQQVTDEECQENLNCRQEQVVRLISSSGSGVTKGVTRQAAPSFSGPTMVLGPFGTGKTHTLAKGIQRTLRERKDARFLICTHSNSAADLYIKEYLHEFCMSCPEIWMLRVYTTVRKLNTIEDIVKKYMLIDGSSPHLPTLEERREWVSGKGPSIVVVTLSTAVELTKAATLQGYFSHIVIDEAGQALETEAIIPLSLATEKTSVILAGDPRQMSPKVYSSRTLEAKFDMSLLQRLFKYDKQNDCHASLNLIINYRSCQPILDFLKVHYGTAFQSKSTSRAHPHLYPLTFFDVRGQDKFVGSDYMNEEEARNIVECVRSLVFDTWPEEEWGPRKQSDVVVLSPYRLQVNLIRRELRKQGLSKVTVETVQNVQGKQYRAVFLSTVRTRSSLNKVDITSLPQVGGRNVRNRYSYGFLSDKGLLNTAFTRAQSLITVMGDPVTLCSTGECQKTWQRFIKKCEGNNGIISDQHLTFASIQNEIDNAKRMLNPEARVFIPRAANSRASSRGSSRAAEGSPKISRAIEVQGCSMAMTRPQRAAQRSPTSYPASGNREPVHAAPIPVASPVGASVSNDDDEDDDEDLLADEWLRELNIQVKIQVDEDMDEYRRTHPKMRAEGLAEEALSKIGSENQAAAIRTEEGQSAIPIPETEAELQLDAAQRRQGSVSRARARVPDAVGHSEREVLPNLRTVERNDRYAFLDTYDSDDDDEARDDSGQAQEASVNGLLQKALQNPDKFKICIFHQDIFGRAFAVPLDRQSGEQITITSMKRRGHALNSDKVLMEILENEEQEADAEDDDAEGEIKVYGRVEGIIEHKANLRLQKIVCFLDPQSDNVMVPIDRSMPKMIILGRKRRNASNNNAAVVTLYDVKATRSARTGKACSSQKDVEVKSSERHQKLFVVRYLEWPQKAPLPLGAAVEELEPGNTQKKGHKILKLVHGIKVQCKSAAKQEMEHKFPEGWNIPPEAIQKRRDLRLKTIFTIDPPGSTDLDDAISYEPLPGHYYRVGVHIADVSYFIHQDGHMDKDAYKRGTTFYHPFKGDVSHMLPGNIVTRLLSLLPLEDRLAVSIFFTLDQQGHIVEEPLFERSVIRSCQRLTYAEAQELIANGNSSNLYMRVAEPIRRLHQLSRLRRMERLRDGWIVFNADDDEGGAVSHPDAHSLIEELMLMANKAVAEHILARFPDRTPLRRQLAPSQEQMEAWMERHASTARNSIHLAVLVETNANNVSLEDRDERQTEDQGENPTPGDVLIAAEVFNMLRQLCQAETISRSDVDNMANCVLQDANHPLHAVALSDCFRIMEPAEYIDTTSQRKPEKQEHYSLKMAAYTHFTSPIRRYIDLIVHRMLVACIEDSQCPYTASEMADITHHCNSQRAKSKRYEKATKELKLALKLKEAPLQTVSFVEGISDTSLKLLLPYRSYVPYRQREVPFRFLKPSEKPMLGSDDVQLTWKYRMYDNSLKCPAHSPGSANIGFPVLSYRVPEQKWQQILQAIKNMHSDGDLEGVKMAIETALLHARANENPFSVKEQVQNGRPEQREHGIMGFQRSYQTGDPCMVQMHAKMVRGMITPGVQLFNMTHKLDICTEHRSSPIECFSKIADEVPGKEKNITGYKSKWLPILSMTSCYSAVSADDSVTLQHVPIQWHRTAQESSGHFQLNKEFLETEHIPITESSDGKLRNDFDYLCIHLTNLDVDSKPRLKIMEYDERGHRHGNGPFNVNDWKKQTCVFHCRIVKGQGMQDCHTCQRLLSEDEDMIPVHFIVHQQSVPLPTNIPDRHVASTVEFIAVPEPNRREEQAVSRVDDKNIPVLVRDIALQRENKPDWHTDDILRILRREAAALTNLNVPETTLHPLNPSQQAAVKKALENTFSVIQGPPGTGKTVTGAYLAYFFTRLNLQLPPGKVRPQVLYCGPSNKSVDVVAGYLKKFSNISIIRVYSEQIERKEFPIPGVPGLVSKWSRKEVSMPEDLADIALHRVIRERGKPRAEAIASYERKFRRNPSGIKPKDVKDYKRVLFEAVKLELKNHHIVLCTCNAAGAFRMGLHTRVIQVIVDEAGMCSEPESLIPLVAMKPKQVVLVGDHQQLRSIITEPNAKNLGMDISLLEKYKGKAEMLTIQYRMHVQICKFPSKAFYDDKLQTAESVKRRGRDPIRSIWPNNGTTPRVFCHVNGREETLSVKSEEGNEMSKSNKAEIKHVIRIIREMIRRGALPEQIVILSQYRLQCAQIEEKLREDRDQRLQQIKVSTVVKSQGSEWDYVVLSTVRSKPLIEIEEKPSRGWQKKHLGFINDENQMNVALTRAKRGLAIIGNKNLLQCHKRWKEMLKMYEATRCLVDAQDFPAGRPR